jgi:hypothetical protein
MTPHLQVLEYHETDECHTSSTISSHDDTVIATLRTLRAQAEYVRLSCEQISETYDQCSSFMPTDVCEDLRQSLQLHHRVLQDIEHKFMVLERIQMNYYAGLIDESRYVSQTASIVAQHVPQ